MSTPISKKRIIWTIIKHNPVLTMIAIFVVTNLITAVLTGGIHLIGILTNLFPAGFGYFLSAMHNENRKARIETDKDKFRA